MSSVTTVIEDMARGVHLEVWVEGAGDDVVLVPSAMRGAADFATLQADLAEAGYRSLAVNLRGAGKSTPPSPDVTLHDLAEDLAFVVRSLCRDRAHLVGHTLGNIVVRATASFFPDVAATVTAMPCAGHNLRSYPLPPEVRSAFARCHDASLPPEKRLQALEVAFFAPGNDASSWLEGWFPRSSFGAAMASEDAEQWWSAGTAPLLIMQPLNDAMAPAAVGREVAAAIGPRAVYVELPHCGHAILPEQPDAVASHLIDFLRLQS